MSNIFSLSGLRPPVQLQTAELHLDLQRALSLAGPHPVLLLQGGHPYHLVLEPLQTPTVDLLRLCPPGLTVHPPVCPGEWALSKQYARCCQV